jgi:transcriptional regulator with XRE-family HTH domain
MAGSRFAVDGNDNRRVRSRIPRLWPRLLGRRLKFLRTVVNKEHSRQPLIRATGVTESAVLQWERGEAKPSLDNFRKLADYYMVPLDYLLFREGWELTTDELEELYDLPANSPGALTDRWPSSVRYDFLDRVSGEAGFIYG